MGKKASKFSDMDRSVSEYFYEADGTKGHRCGYCQQEDSSVSNGMWTHYLTCEDYQDLIDRGWRRSGKYCYKPVMDVTCCPQYAIRCEAAKFRLSNSQKKVLKIMNDYLLNGKGKTSEKPKSVPKVTSSSRDTDSTDVTPAASKAEEGKGRKDKSVKPGVGADSSKPRCRKAKEVRREMKLKKQVGKSESDLEAIQSHHTSSDCAEASKSDSVAATNTQTSSKETKVVQDIPEIFKVGPDGKKPLEEFLHVPVDAKLAHKLELKLVRSHPPSAEFKSTFRESFELYKKYQTTIHKDSEDDCTEKQYRRFLCDSPLIPKTGAAGWPCDYGSYHQHYRIDGKLVAVGVIDFLPKCLSSVYTYYDPDFNFLTLGVYTALRELELTRKLYLSDTEHFQYYCMGYYLHRCQKMRYKGQYYPSYLLCPESYQYIPIETCRPKLDASRFARLNEKATPPEDVSTWLDQSLVLFQRTIMPYAIYKSLSGTGEDDKMKEYACFVGPSVATRMVVVL